MLSSQKGFEPRGTAIGQRLVTWNNMVKNTGYKATLANYPFKYADEQAKKYFTPICYTTTCASFFTFFVTASKTHSVPRSYLRVQEKETTICCTWLVITNRQHGIQIPLGYYWCSYLYKMSLFSHQQGYKPKQNVVGVWLLKYSLTIPAHKVIIISLIEGLRGEPALVTEVGRGEQRSWKDTVDGHADKSESPLERKGEQSRHLSIHKVIHCFLSAGVCSLIKSRSLHVFLSLSLWLFTVQVFVLSFKSLLLPDWFFLHLPNYQLNHLFWLLIVVIVGLHYRIDTTIKTLVSDELVRSNYSESRFVSCFHVVRIRTSKNCSSTLLISKWVLPAAVCLPLCLLLCLWLSLSSFLSRSTRLSADVIVYLWAYGVARGLWCCQQASLPHPVRLSTPQSPSDSHLITRSLTAM